MLIFKPRTVLDKHILLMEIVKRKKITFITKLKLLNT